MLSRKQAINTWAHARLPFYQLKIHGHTHCIYRVSGAQLMGSEYVARRQPAGGRVH